MFVWWGLRIASCLSSSWAFKWADVSCRTLKNLRGGPFPLWASSSEGHSGNGGCLSPLSSHKS